MTKTPPDHPQPDDEVEDPVAALILMLLAEAGPERSLDPITVAKTFAATRTKPKDPPDLWRRYLPAVRQQALYLARRGRIQILRKGKPVDPHAPVKGLIKLAMADLP
jgi:hypothetical protein